MWMGGPVPIGYRLKDRKLHIEPDEAATVRMTFERYCELRSIPQLVDELAAKGIKTKRRVYKSGKTVGGIPFSKGSLACLLKNPIYTGSVRNRDKIYKGEHDAIIGRELFDRAQQIMRRNGRDRRLGRKAKNPSLLAGLVTDPDGRPMTPVHTSKPDRRYRYYVTRFAPGEDAKTPWRIPAGELERIAIQLVVKWLRATDGEDATEVAARSDLADRFAGLPIAKQHEHLIEYDITFEMAADAITLISGTANTARVTATVPARFLTHGQDRKLAIAPEGSAASSEPDPVLIKLLANAEAAQKMVLHGSNEPTVDRYGKRHLWQLLRIAWLAPDIVSAIIEGRQPIGLTGRRLLRAADLPLDWAEQRMFLGFS